MQKFLIRFLVVIGLVGAAMMADMNSEAPDAMRFDGTLITQNGQEFTYKDLAGSPSIIFFGFTTCADICPPKMLEMTQALEALGKDANKFKFMMITVDPDRDDVEAMKEYVDNFDPRILGLTGPADALASAKKSFGVYTNLPEGTHHSMMAHTASFFLLDSKARFVKTINLRDPKTIQFLKEMR